MSRPAASALGPSTSCARRNSQSRCRPTATSRRCIAHLAPPLAISPPPGPHYPGDISAQRARHVAVAVTVLPRAPNSIEATTRQSRGSLSIAPRPVRNVTRLSLPDGRAVLDAGARCSWASLRLGARTHTSARPSPSVTLLPSTPTSAHCDRSSALRPLRPALPHVHPARRTCHGAP